MIARQIETQLRKLAKMYPVVTITGPRQSGKTTLAKAVFPEHRYVSLENFDVRQMAQADPKGFCSWISRQNTFRRIKTASG
jgi:AAA+ ATPase superfamily predicted ATPase